MVTDGTHSALAQDFLDQTLMDGASLFTLPQLPLFAAPLSLNQIGQPYYYTGKLFRVSYMP